MSRYLASLMSHSPEGMVYLLYVPDVDNLRGKILEENHGSRNSFLLGDTKMYRDLQEVY